MGEAAASHPERTRDQRFGDRVRELRKAAGFESQEALARALGVSLFTVSRWERGAGKPDFNGLYRLAEILGVQASDLLPDVEAVA